MTKINMITAINQALRHAMQEDKTVLLMGEDVGVDGGVFRASEGLQKDFGKDRVIDTPLAEAGIVGTAIGLSLNGFKPVAEIQFVGFAYEAFHQINHNMSRFRQRTEGTFTVPMVLRSPMGGGIRALELHSESPETFFVHSQGLKVVIPSGPYDAKGLLLSAIKDPDPVIFLEPEKLYRSFKEEVPEEAYTIPLGEANVIREGKDITLVAWGAMVRQCIEAADKLAEENISAEIIDLRTLWPLDTPKIITSVEKTGRAVVVYEAPRAVGFGTEIITRIQEKALLSLEAPVGRVTGFDIPYPQFAMEKYFLPNVGRIIKGVKDTINF